jgi:hypothetical protein
MGLQLSQTRSACLLHAQIFLRADGVPNSRSIALPVLTLFPPALTLLPPTLTLFPAFFGPITGGFVFPAGVVFPTGLPLFRAEPGVEVSPKLLRTRWACDMVRTGDSARRYGRGMFRQWPIRGCSRNAIRIRPIEWQCRWLGESNSGRASTRNAVESSAQSEGLAISVIILLESDSVRRKINFL